MKRDGAASRNRYCQVCNRLLTGRQKKTCSDAHRKLVSRRRKEVDWKARAVGDGILQLKQTYEIGGMDDETALAVIDYLERKLNRLKVVHHMRTTHRNYS